ncbi:MAG TPA: tetratricopeptide repeat protein, partial [Geminicoccaceae bacterium]|nr:tetratricopeptide repeat protein [Geminicoccaceae bacterium]
MMRLWLLTLALLLGLASGAQADPMEDLRAGNTAFKEGRYEEAVQAYTKSIISGQLGAEALAVTFNNRGVAYGELGDFDRAILDYNEALALKQDDATAIRNLRVGLVRRGVAQANMGEVERALADYDKAIELDPSHFLAYLRRGQLRLERGEMQAAIQDLEQVEALDPYNQQAKELLAQARTQLAQGDRQAPAATAAEPAPASAAATPPVVASAEEPPAGPAVPAPAAAPEPSITVTAAP